MTDTYYVYVLKSVATGKRYTGQTDDLKKRLAQHNSGFNPRGYTARQTGPWIAICTEEYATRSEAKKRERWLKSGVGRQWLDDQEGRAGPPSAN